MRPTPGDTVQSARLSKVALHLFKRVSAGMPDTQVQRARRKLGWAALLAELQARLG